MPLHEQDILARQFCLSSLSVGLIGTVMGWLYYDVSGAVLGAIIGGLAGVIGAALWQLKRRS